MSYASVITADTPLMWYRFRDNTQTADPNYGADVGNMASKYPPYESSGWSGIAIDGGSLACANNSLQEQKATTLTAHGHAWTMEGWFYIAGGSTFFSSLAGGGFNFFSVVKSGVSNLTIQVVWNTTPSLTLRSTSGNDVVGGTAITLATWHHLAWTYVGGGLQVLYLDGASLGSSTNTASTTASAATFGWGWSLGGAPMFWSEVAMYATNLSSGQIAAHHAAADQLTTPKPRPFQLNGAC